jgi:hypothetical protein
MLRTLITTKEFDMESIAFWLALWAIMDGIEYPARYEAEHFHYYDEQRKLHGAPLQNKLFVEGNQPEILSNLASCLKSNPKVISAQVLRNSDREGVVLTTKSKDDTLELLNILGRFYTVYPVVMWEGIESIPTPEVILQAQPAVTEILLNQRLRTLGKFVIQNISKTDAGFYVVSFGKTKVPSNILVLANIVAEDHAWVKWAMPKFQPLFGKITASMYVSTPADTNLGEMRQLNIVANVYSPNIKVRADLLPAIGQGGLVVAPQAEETWIDGSSPTVKEEIGVHKRTYTITYPFRYCRPGQNFFQPFNLVYEEDKKSKTIQVPVAAFQIPSVLNDTIDDIRPIAQSSFLRTVTTPDVSVPQKLLYLNVVGLGLFLLGGFVMVGMGSRAAAKWHSNWWLANRQKHGREQEWEELRRLANRISIASASWRDDYQKVSEQMSKVMATFFDIHKPISAAMCTNYAVRTIFEELERLYQQDALPPSPIQLSSLTTALETFCEDRQIV